ncbi:S41 family peptidase [Dyadobacter psychrotolerans]|uniref:Tail specific protease domain-containing protein n=1 Tax=Dyadobacter psychrotolerans TaxID=2541721 RepID=A0A4R5DGH7_9BACT|nr:S41 family peptidase [Dyadobacter psychrotolerans]TDE12909.1 hypothetical protein E0F88_21460 [Dyadobacter psychrotolerans]
MKIKLSFTLSILFFLFTKNGFSAAGKDFTIEKQFYYSKVWGFLKYDHPAIASGKADADSVFLSVLPAVDKAGNQAEFDKVLNDLLNQLNSVTTPVGIKTAKAGPLLTKNIDWKWRQKDKFLSGKIKKRLEFIYQNRFTDSLHYYIPARNYDTGIPHEKGYAFADSTRIPYAYRMLSLAKIQAAVDYLFPHKYLMDKPWDSTVKEAIPVFAASASRQEYEKSLLLLSAKLNDTHAFSFYKSLKYGRKILHNRYYQPFDFTIIQGNQILVTKSIIDEFCTEADIKPGDVITAINGQAVSDRIEELNLLLSASNRNALLHRLGKFENNLLFYSDSLFCTLTYLRNDLPKTTKIQLVGSQKKDLLTRLNVYLNNKLSTELTGSELDYVTPEIVRFKIGQLARFPNTIPDEKFGKTMDSLLTLTARSKGLIFDMRDYPYWPAFIYTYVNQKFNRFLDTSHANYYAVNKENVGSFKLLSHPEVYRSAVLKPERFNYPGKVVIIVNGATLSLSEFQTMNLQQIFPESITIGEPSAGADGDYKNLMLPGGYNFPFTGNAIFYPNGKEAQREGVKIDLIIHPEANDILNGKDTLLNKAINVIETK